MIYLLAFVVLVLAAARATRVIVIDDVAIGLRSWVLADTKKIWRLKFGKTPWLAKLVVCYWCAGFWVSLLLVLFVHTYACVTGQLSWHTMWLAPITTLAVAYASSWVLDKEGVDGGI